MEQRLLRFRVMTCELQNGCLLLQRPPKRFDGRGVQERIRGPEHPDVILSCYNLAACLEAEKKPGEALAFMQRAEAGWRKALGPGHPLFKNAQQARERIEAELKKQQAGGK